MKTLFFNSLIIFIALSFCSASMQAQEAIFVETQATITDIQTQINGKRSVVTAKVDYVTEAGDSLSSQTTLLHIPFIGSTKDVGDTVSIFYQKDNPYFIRSKNESFMQAYGWYVIAAITLLYIFVRFRTRRKN